MCSTWPKPEDTALHAWISLTNQQSSVNLLRENRATWYTPSSRKHMLLQERQSKPESSLEGKKAVELWKPWGVEWGGKTVKNYPYLYLFIPV